MTNEITMNALVAKRAEILFEVDETEKRIARLQTELVHTPCSGCSGPTLRSRDSPCDIAGQRNLLTSRTAR